jgi:hypothetical protein
LFSFIFFFFFYYFYMFRGGGGGGGEDVGPVQHYIYYYLGPMYFSIEVTSVFTLRFCSCDDYGSEQQAAYSDFFVFFIPTKCT